MKRFAFISRHVPSQAQIDLAAKGEVELVHVGDRQGFKLPSSERKPFDGAITLHPDADLSIRLFASGLPVGVFRDNKFWIYEPKGPAQTVTVIFNKQPNQL